MPLGGAGQALEPEEVCLMVTGLEEGLGVGVSRRRSRSGGVGGQAADVALRFQVENTPIDTQVFEI